MTRQKLFILVGLIVIAPTTACKKDAKKGDEGGGGASAKPADKGGGDKAAAGPFGDWDMAARKAAFQGAHVAPGGSTGFWEAWNVEGDKVTVWDGTAEKVLALDVRSPCEVAITENSDGGSSSTIHHYTLEAGQLIMGPGDTGAVKDKTAIACVSDKVVSLAADGTCLTWEQDMFDKTKYKSEPGTCSLGKDGDKDVFKATVNGHETVLEVHGDALYTEQIRMSHGEKAADFAAAKAARDARK